MFSSSARKLFPPFCLNVWPRPPSPSSVSFQTLTCISSSNMSRRKRANPVRVAAYVEEKQKLPHVDESAISHADVENCKPGHGTPVFIEPPRLEERVWADFYIFQLFMNERTITKYIKTLHHASRKNFTEPSRGSDTVLFTTSPPLRHSGTNLIKRYNTPLSFNRNF